MIEPDFEEIGKRTNMTTESARATFESLLSSGLLRSDGSLDPERLAEKKYTAKHQRTNRDSHHVWEWFSLSRHCTLCGIEDDVDAGEIAKLEQQLAQARANEAAWEQTHQQGMADLRKLVLREHQQLMQARALLERCERLTSGMRVERMTDVERATINQELRAFLADHPH